MFITRIAALLYKTRIYWMKEGTKLNASSNTLKWKLQLSEAKTFSKSIATRISGISLYLAYSITSSIVLTHQKLFSPLQNAFWLKWITSGSTFAKRFAKVLDPNLASTFTRDIGRQFFTNLLSFSFFSIKVITPVSVSSIVHGIQKHSSDYQLSTFQARAKRPSKTRLLNHRSLAIYSFGRSVIHWSIHHI